MSIKQTAINLLTLWTATAFIFTAHAEEKTLIIGTKITPPFVMQETDGSLTGISIDLWEQIAADLGIKYRFEQRDLAGLISGLQDGSLDASIAALTITPNREKVIDFTHPFYTTGLSIATTSSKTSLWNSIGKLFSMEFLYAVGALAALLLAIGFLLWMVEHKQNAEQFGGGTARGLGSSFWWAAVTMTTVGYGDKAPTTLCGRIIAIIWMFAAIILISSFTAAIATSLTVNQLSTKVKDKDDLPTVSVLAVANSSAAEFLKNENINFKKSVDLKNAIRELATHKVDAVIYDAPLIQYLANTEFKGKIEALPQILRREDYGIALPASSPMREQMNQSLLAIIGSEAWRETLEGYLGQ